MNELVLLRHGNSHIPILKSETGKSLIFYMLCHYPDPRNKENVPFLELKIVTKFSLHLAFTVAVCAHCCESDCSVLQTVPLDTKSLTPYILSCGSTNVKRTTWELQESLVQ